MWNAYDAPPRSRQPRQSRSPQRAGDGRAPAIEPSSHRAIEPEPEPELEPLRTQSYEEWEEQQGQSPAEALDAHISRAHVARAGVGADGVRLVVGGRVRVELQGKHIGKEGELMVLDDSKAVIIVPERGHRGAKRVVLMAKAQPAKSHWAMTRIIEEPPEQPPEQPPPPPPPPTRTRSVSNVTGRPNRHAGSPNTTVPRPRKGKRKKQLVALQPAEAEASKPRWNSSTARPASPLASPSLARSSEVDDDSGTDDDFDELEDAAEASELFTSPQRARPRAPRPRARAPPRSPGGSSSSARDRSRASSPGSQAKTPPSRDSSAPAAEPASPLPVTAQETHETTTGVAPAAAVSAAAAVAAERAQPTARLAWGLPPVRRQGLAAVDGRAALFTELVSWGAHSKELVELLREFSVSGSTTGGSGPLAAGVTLEQAALQRESETLATRVSEAAEHAASFCAWFGQAKYEKLREPSAAQLDEHVREASSAGVPPMAGALQRPRSVQQDGRRSKSPPGKALQQDVRSRSPDNVANRHASPNARRLKAAARAATVSPSRLSPPPKLATASAVAESLSPPPAAFVAGVTAPTAHRHDQMGQTWGDEQLARQLRQEEEREREREREADVAQAAAQVAAEQAAAARQDAELQRAAEVAAAERMAAEAEREREHQRRMQQLRDQELSPDSDSDPAPPAAVTAVAIATAAFAERRKQSDPDQPEQQAFEKQRPLRKNFKAGRAAMVTSGTASRASPARSRLVSSGPVPADPARVTGLGWDGYSPTGKGTEGDVSPPRRPPAAVFQAAAREHKQRKQAAQAAGPIDRDTAKGLTMRQFQRLQTQQKEQRKTEKRQEQTLVDVAAAAMMEAMRAEAEAEREQEQEETRGWDVESVASATSSTFVSSASASAAAYEDDQTVVEANVNVDAGEYTVGYYNGAEGERIVAVDEEEGDDEEGKASAAQEEAIRGVVQGRHQQEQEQEEEEDDADAGVMKQPETSRGSGAMPVEERPAKPAQRGRRGASNGRAAPNDRAGRGGGRGKKGGRGGRGGRGNTAQRRSPARARKAKQKSKPKAPSNIIKPIRPADLRKKKALAAAETAETERNLMQQSWRSSDDEDEEPETAPEPEPELEQHLHQEQRQKERHRQTAAGFGYPAGEDDGESEESDAELFSEEEP